MARVGAPDYGAMDALTIRLAPEIKAALVREAKENELSLADVVRAAVRDYARRSAERWQEDRR